MADGGRNFQPVYNIHIHTVQEGDKTEVRVEKKTELNIHNSNFEQLLILSQESSQNNCRDFNELPIENQPLDTTPKAIGAPSSSTSLKTISNLSRTSDQSSDASTDMEDPKFQEWIKIEGTEIKYNPKNCLGNRSKVFEGVRKALENEAVAVKFITDYSEKNKREVKHLLNAGASENVVRYFQSGIFEFTQKAIFIAMEQCEENALCDRIGSDGLEYNERRNYLRCIAEGLQHLKKKNIMHRDLKPQNVLFRNGSPVLSDFGLSKEHPIDRSKTVQSIENVGTDGWRAPETSQIGSETSYDADIYSAGLLFYYILTNGMHPYGKKSHHWQTLIDLDEDGTKCNLQALYETPDGAIAFDLIESMLRRNPKKRISIEAVLKHPFFFTAKQSLDFLSDAHATVYEGRVQMNLDSLSGKYGRKIEESEIILQKYWKEVAEETKNWNPHPRINKKKLPETDGNKSPLTKREQIEDEEKSPSYGENEDKRMQLTEGNNKRGDKNLPHKKNDGKMVDEKRDNEDKRLQLTEENGNTPPTKKDGKMVDAKKNDILRFTEKEKDAMENMFKQDGEEIKVNINAMIEKTIAEGKKRTKLYGNSLSELLRFIRNRHAHYIDDENNKSISMTREQFFKFFSDRFPHLFIYVFSRFKHYNFHKEKNDKNLPDTISQYFSD